MYIPMNENETKQFRLPEPYDIVLIVKPFTGKNETIYINNSIRARSIPDDDENGKLNTLRDTFDHFVKGYIDQSGETVMFSDSQKPSEFFGVDPISAFMSNIRSINMLTIEEKKT